MVNTAATYTKLYYLSDIIDKSRGPLQMDVPSGLIRHKPSLSLSRAPLGRSHLTPPLDLPLEDPEMHRTSRISPQLSAQRSKHSDSIQRDPRLKDQIGKKATNAELQKQAAQEAGSV